MECSVGDVIILSGVLVIPRITKNLLFVRKLTFDYAGDVLFTTESFIIQSHQTKSILACGRRRDSLYVIDNSLSALVVTRVSSRLVASFEL